jgi:hypothetical protein
MSPLLTFDPALHKRAQNTAHALSGAGFSTATVPPAATDLALSSSLALGEPLTLSPRVGRDR